MIIQTTKGKFWRKIILTELLDYIHWSIAVGVGVFVGALLCWVSFRDKYTIHQNEQTTKKVDES